MRPFWQSIALLLLALFVPGTLHCLPGGCERMHVADVAKAVSASVHVPCAESDSCGAASSVSTQAGDQSAQDRGHHACPAQTLAHTQLPSVLKAPAQPQSQLDDTCICPALFLTSILSALHTISDSSQDFTADSSAKLRLPGWAFRIRAALPARWPSDVV
jgi:hypothetical protein